MMVPEGTGYTKKIGRWHVDLNTQTCDCPAYMGRLETARRIEDLHVEILLGTEVQQKLAQRQLNMLSPFPGVTCKHLLAAMALANLISLKDEFMSFSDVIRIKAKAHFEAEKHAEEAILATGKPEPKVVNLGHKEKAPAPLLVPVIEVKGLIDPKTHIQWGVTLEKNGHPMSRAHFVCDLVDGHYDPEGTQLRAMDLFPSEHYKINLVVVQLAMCQYYKPLPATLLC